MEAKLAETAPKRPLAVTVGAAVATLVIIAGVLTGPTILTCSGSPEGFGACFSGKLSDIGILPKPAPVAVAETTPPAADTAQTAVPPTTETPDTGLPANIPDIITPTFGLLRAEPDGSVVIAGSGKPGTEVEVFSNDAPIGKAKVEPSGDWVLVPEKPLPDGGVELTVGEAGGKDRSSQSFVVVIDPDHKNEPLVVASAPGKASEVLQGLAKAGSEPPMQVANAETPAPAHPVASETAGNSTAPSAFSKPEAAPAQQPTTEQPAAGQPAADQPAVAAEPAQSADSAATPAATPVEASQPDAPATVAAATPQAPATDQPAPGTTAPAAAETQVAKAEEPAAAATPEPAAVAAVAPSIDAIEIDGNRNFFAGAGPDGATVRLYVDDRFIADSLVRGGRWLVETTENVLSKSAQIVRVDVLRPGTSEVVSRAEVNFEVQLPNAPEAPVAVAEAQPPATATPAAPAADAQDSTSVAAPADQSAAAASSSSDAAPATEAAAPTETAAAAPGTETAPAETAPAQVAETPAQSDIPTMIGVAVGNDPEGQRFASGRAIIRSGDNLWTIARRVYGKGIKYTTIYEANVTQIRDPDLIYPGQVFDLPDDKQP